MIVLDAMIVCYALIDVPKFTDDVKPPSLRTGGMSLDRRLAQSRRFWALSEPAFTGVVEHIST